MQLASTGLKKKIFIWEKLPFAGNRIKMQMVKCGGLHTLVRQIRVVGPLLAPSSLSWEDAAALAVGDGGMGGGLKSHSPSSLTHCL